MNIRTQSGDNFEMTCDMIDATSLHRVDPAWKFFDKQEHVHQWFHDQKPAVDYHPTKHYTLPTLKRVIDVEASDEYPAVWHFECKQCGEHISPGYTCDTNQVLVPGIRRYRINDQSVTEAEFKKRIEEVYEREKIRTKT